MIRFPRAALAGLLVLFAACGGDGTTTSNPTPGVTSLDPNRVQQGAAETSLMVVGSDFVRASVVRFNGQDRPTRYVSRTELHATLSSADLASAGMAQIVVVNPAPGGGASNPMQLTIAVGQNPVPVVSALAPAAIAAGSPATTLTVTGSGFVAQSQVTVGLNPRPTTYVSPTQLRVSLSDTLLASGASLPVSVINPWPGGGVSAPWPLEVRTPQPVLSSLSTTQTTAGQTSFTLGVTGTGFVANSVIHLNGGAVPTVFVSATALQARLSESTLRTAGTFNVTVVNGAPGGGTSAPLTLQVVHATPAVTVLPSRGATAGRPGFTLYVHGTGFVDGSVVRWNGADRPTQYLSGTRLAATIAAGDVAAPGTAQISVHTPAPGGGTSGAASFTVRSLGAATATTRRMALPGRDLVYDPGTSRLFATVSSASSAHPNSIAEIDPASGTVTRSVFVGSEPGRIARSEDGQYLYVGLNGANGVRRVTLATLTPGLQWSLDGGQVAGDLEVMPGRPGTVAVSRQRPGFSPPLEGVTIYDDGVARPQSSPGHTGGNRIEFLESPSTLYGYNNSHTGFEFFTMSVDAQGVRHSVTSGGLISGFYTDIVGESGRIYSTLGAVVDAERRFRVGTIGGGHAVAVDARLGRAFVLADAGINTYDLNTFQLLGSVSIAGLSFEHPANLVSRLVRWGDDGLAFRDTNGIVLVRSPLFGP